MITTRRAIPENWLELRDVRLRALQDTPSAFGSTFAREVQFTEQVWRGRLAGSGYYFALDPDEIVLGLAAGYADPEGPAMQRELVSMWVAPPARGRGAAGLLVDAVAEWARADGADELALWVVDGNLAARRAYERAGFVATGESQRVEAGDPRIESRMVLRL